MAETVRKFKVGGRVFTEAYGFGEVCRAACSKFGVKVIFDSGDECLYMSDGRYLNYQAPTLHHVNTGVIEIDTTEVPELEVDAKVWVRDSEQHAWLPYHFRKFNRGKIQTFFNGRTSHTHKPEIDSLILWRYYRTTDPAKDELEVSK